MRFALALLLAPAITFAQSSFPTEFPNGALPLTADALKQRLLGKTFVAKSLTGPDVRTEYRETYVYLNIGNTNDTGTWKTEGSTVCMSGDSCDRVALKCESLATPSTSSALTMARS